MVKIGNFRNYLVSQNRKRYGHLLKEGLTDIKELVFPNIDICDAIRFLRIMPGWKNEILNSKMKLEFKSDQDFTNFKSTLQEAVKNFKKNVADDILGGFDDKSVKKSGGTVIEFKLHVPDQIDADSSERYCEQIFQAVKTFFGRNKLGSLIGSLGRAGDVVTIRPDGEQDGMTAWKGLAALSNDKNIAENTAQAILAANSNKNDKAAAKAAMKPFIQNVQKALAQLKIPEETPDSVVQAVKNAQKTTSVSVSVDFSGNYNVCTYVYRMFFYRNTGKHVPDAAQDFLSLDVPVKRGILLIDNEMFNYDGNLVQSCKQAITLVGAISKQQRNLLQQFSRACQPHDDKWKAGIQNQISALKQKVSSGDYDKQAVADFNNQIKQFEADLKQPQQRPADIINNFIGENIGLRAFNYMKLRADDIKDARNAVLKRLDGERPVRPQGRELTADEKKRYEELEKAWNQKVKEQSAAAEKNVKHVDIDEFGGLSNMVKAVKDSTSRLFGEMSAQSRAADMAMKKQKLAGHTPNFTNAVAKRRWKLFEAFKRTDNGEVYANDDWTVSICKTSHQLAIFSRNKPKVDDSGKIIEAANLEDWENITPPYRKIRDGGGAWVRDGLNSRYDDMETETCWCCAGSYANHVFNPDQQTPLPWYHNRAHIDGGSSYSDYRVKDSQHGKILIQFMDNHTGMLYMLGNMYILDEGDGESGKLCGRTGIAALKKNCDRFPSLGSLITECGLYDTLIEKAGFSRQKTEQELLSDALADDTIQPDGEMCISSADQLQAYKSLIGCVSRINVNMSDASLLFESAIGGENVDLPPINCKRVSVARRMFARVHSPHIILENTGGIADMDSMFIETYVQDVTGLDTKSANNISDIFRDCRQKVFQMVSIPALDLRNCCNITNAFYGSYIASVKMVNTDKIRRAKDAFVNMPFLQKTPDIMFKNIIDPRWLRSEFRNDYASIFDGCDTILGTKEFDNKIMEIEHYYQHPGNRDGKSDLVDDRNYLIIRDSDDVDNYASIMYRYNGVVIDDGANTFRLFSSIDNLKIRVLDVNGHKDIANLIYHCRYFSIGRIIGTENVKTATGMFAKSSCSICPKLDLPNLAGTIDVFQDMPVFGNHSSPGLLKTGKFVQAFDISEDAANYIQLIAIELFGEQSTQWQNNTVIMNVIQYFYTNCLTNKNKILLDQYKLDGDGVITVDEVDIKKNLDIILQLKPKVLKLSDDMVERMNSGAFCAIDYDMWDLTRRKNISVPDIDLNGLKIGDGLFENARFTNHGKIIGLDKVAQAINMFRHADIGDLFTEKITFSELLTATRMFDGFKQFIHLSKLDFPRLKTANFMFYATKVQETSIESLNFQNLVTATYMLATDHDSNIEYIGEINAPNLTNGSYMFYAHHIKAIGEINIPRCGNLSHMFNSCGRLQKIGNIVAPAADNCSSMFFNCKNLNVIHMFNFGSTISQAPGMFDSCRLKPIYGQDGKTLFARSKLLNGN